MVRTDCSLSFPRVTYPVSVANGEEPEPSSNERSGARVKRESETGESSHVAVAHDWFAPFGKVTREPLAKGDWRACSQATVSQARIHDSALHAKRERDSLLCSRLWRIDFGATSALIRSRWERLYVKRRPQKHIVGRRSLKKNN